MKKSELVKIILAALFAALIAVGAFIKVPIPPVPITLQTLFALICGLLLPISVSLPSVLTYLFLGVIGLPIFTSGGGLAAITGPTGGYLVGLIPAVIVCGLISGKGKKSLAVYIIGALLGTVALYIPGLVWLGCSRHLSLGATLSGGLVPFLIGDTIKIIVSALVANALKERVEDMISKEE